MLKNTKLTMEENISVMKTLGPSGPLRVKQKVYIKFISKSRCPTPLEEIVVAFYSKGKTLDINRNHSIKFEFSFIWLGSCDFFDIIYRKQLNYNQHHYLSIKGLKS